jgi:hypothetical protein
VLVIDGADFESLVALLFVAQDRLPLVVERAAGKACYLQQVRQLMVTPQPGDQTRFVGAADLFDRIKAYNFFRYATSARSRSFSSRRACAESVITVVGGAGQRGSGFILERPCFLLPRASTPSSSSLRRQTTT